MAKFETNSQRILKWLKDNGMGLGALTSTDARCLRASVEIAEIYCSIGHNSRLFETWGNVVRWMQPSTRYLAFHGVAMVLDWTNRQEFWQGAGFSLDDLRGAPECKYGPAKQSA